MGQVTQSRFSALLKRVLALRTVDPGAAVGPFIQPGAEVNDAYQPELRLMRGERLFTIVNSLTNTAATTFGRYSLCNAPGSGKLGVVKRFTWCANIPTAANQPGNCFVAALAPLFNGVTGTLKGQSKDSRFGGGVAQQSTLAMVGSTSGAFAFAPLALYFFQFFPGAAIAPFTHQADNLDIPIWPGSQVDFVLGSDTLPVGTYNWTGSAECYERTFDPSELIVPAQ